MVKNILNFRTLTEKPNNTGIKLKDGLIFRSGNPGSGDSRDIIILKSLNIDRIYDFRNRDEISESTGIKASPMDIKHIEIIDPANNIFSNIREYGNRTEELMLELYRNIFPVSPGYHDFFSEIIHQETPGFLFHCTAGKDRTGIAAIILMTILDFSGDDIYSEYMASAVRTEKIMFEKIRANFRRAGIPAVEESIIPLATVKEKYFKAFYEGIESRYGNMKGYIREFLKLDDQKIGLLRERYLELKD